MSPPDLACPATGCFICLQLYDVFALTIFALVSWYLLVQHIDSSSPSPTPSPKTCDPIETPASPDKTSTSNVRHETPRYTSLTVPRRPRRVKKLIRADLDLHFSDADSDSEEGLQSIDYSTNFLSLNERDLAKSLADFRQIQTKLNSAISNRSSSRSDGSIGSSSNNHSVMSYMDSDHNSCDSLRETDDLSHGSFLSDTLRNRYHILYEVFNSPEPGTTPAADSACNSETSL